MFGAPKNSATPPPSEGRPQAGDVAKITNNLTHVIVSDELADKLHVFYNGQPILAGLVDSLSVEIIAPEETNQGTLTAILSRYETDATGEKKLKTMPLFPGTVELIAKGRRISITCMEAGSFDGLYLRFGTEDGGAGLIANGVKSLRLVVTPSLLDGRLVWAEDGREDILIP